MTGTLLHVFGYCTPQFHAYIILIQGDFLVHFMDIARDELVKRADEISVEKLQVYVLVGVLVGL